MKSETKPTSKTGASRAPVVDVLAPCNLFELGIGHVWEGHEQQHPAYARKLVEWAVAYARDLGFDPHVDYRIAKAIFGDVDAAACPVKFAFGQDDKPFYVSGPHDSLSMQRRIVTQLERRCGTDGFHFIISETSEGLD